MIWRVIKTITILGGNQSKAIMSDIAMIICAVLILKMESILALSDSASVGFTSECDGWLHNEILVLLPPTGEQLCNETTTV